mgnify:CR=1 FL=1
MKLILIHPNVQNDNLLLSSFNNDCILKRVSEYKTITSLLENIDLTQITHLAFIYHFNRILEIPFYDNLISNKYKYLSNKRKWFFKISRFFFWF